MEKDRNLEKDIIDAAREIFQEKGYKEATMRDIAGKANINIAMLHYYFRSKDNLFYIIFDETFRLLYEKIVDIVASENIEIFEKIRTIVNEYISFFQTNPILPQFIVGEIIRNPGKIVIRMKNIVNTSIAFKIFSLQLQKEVKKGAIRQTSASSLFLNTISLCVFPIIAQPVIQEVFNIKDSDLEAFIINRKKEVGDFIINSLKT